ncbi:MAG: HNH endonuclease [Pyrinomonadaceae bacterium]|nr:HNH endonuclease [Pyrinomonadaceae bacterium]
MRYWWVNQNQTFEQEFNGGYLWSPKRKANSHRNAFYDFMRDVSGGDVIFSFRDTFITAIGIAQGPCFEAPKPEEFGPTGQNWSHIGWKIHVSYFILKKKIRPSRHMDLLAPTLPPKYSPLRLNGYGLQNVYLAAIPDGMANVLVGLIGHEARVVVKNLRISSDERYDAGQVPIEIRQWEDHVVSEISLDQNLSDTERRALIIARRGQGLFRQNVSRIEGRCRVTKVDRLEHLVASHTKPWRDCASNSERLDGYNGLMLTPTVDHLFDRGFISFENGGQLLVSPVVHRQSLVRMGFEHLASMNVGRFNSEQCKYLDFHRNSVFLDPGIK